MTLSSRARARAHYRTISSTIAHTWAHEGVAVFCRGGHEHRPGVSRHVRHVRRVRKHRLAVEECRFFHSGAMLSWWCVLFNSAHSKETERLHNVILTA
jgi:hypothetical protein